MVVCEKLGHYWVEWEGRLYRCRPSNRLRKNLEFSTADPASRARRVQRVRSRKRGNPVVVGDEVDFVPQGEDRGQIRSVHPRRSSLSRLMAGRSTQEQVLVANLDQVIPVFSCHGPEPHWGLLDRFLVTAEASDLTARIVLNKTDLLEEGDGIREAASRYEAAGYEVLWTQALDGEGLEELRRALSGRLSVFVGPSGVGKSSLVNDLDPSLHIEAGAISEATGKGCHTTTHLELYRIDGTTLLIDTPGLRELGLWGVSTETLADCFPEMRSFLGGCRFSGCRHMAEPGCAIKEALAVGQIAPRRYESYEKLWGELDERERIARKRGEFPSC